MPIKVKNNFPAKKILEDENIFIMDENRAMSQDIRPLKILILNLMPLKEDTEVQLMRALSNTPLQVNVTFLTTESYVGKNTPTSHLDEFYVTFSEIENKKYDGLIITGAPVETLAYEEVAYWKEICEIMDWAKTHVTSTLHVCWAAMAGMYHYYGAEKYQFEDKLFGIYPHKVYNRKEPLIRGFDDYFYAPHSRHTGVKREDIVKNDDLVILAESEEAGVFLFMTKDGKRIFVMGHPEYDRMTLDAEYKRDKSKGLPIELPKNYYPEDNPAKKPVLSWRAHANTLYTNGVNYYIYQNTPYDLTK